MTLSHPESAPPRTDLPWLRHRTARTRRPEPAPPPAPPAPAPVPSASTSLELGGPPAPAGRLPPPRLRPGSARPPERVDPGGRRILSFRSPTVTLTRVQSGIGTLTVQAVTSPEVGDLALGAFYELADGTTSLVRAATGLPIAPPGSRRPVLRSSREGHDELTLDLRQARSVRRLLVYAYSESGRELAWGGTLRITTFGGARIEVPMDVGPHAGPVAVLSLYEVAGEFVLRAELERIAGPARTVALRYGYDRITWAGDETPLL